MYIYHLYKGEIVVDEADHTDHIEQHHQGDPDWKRGYIAATLEPLKPEQIARFEAQYGARFNLNKRAKLRDWVPPVVNLRKPYSIRPNVRATKGSK